MKIGIAIKPDINGGTAILHELIDWARTKGHSLIVDPEAQSLLSDTRFKSMQRAEMVSASDIVVSLGGDGTLISVARHANADGPVFVGVHFGTFGFLTEIKSEELIACLERYIAGELKAQERCVLKACVMRGGAEVFSSLAINDVAVQKGAAGRLVTVELGINGESVSVIRGDGIIIASPTGSTAYSLSAGGSIVHPSLPATLITPICPHSLSSRPLIVGLDSEISVSMPDYDTEMYVTVDGQLSLLLEKDDIVRAQRAPFAVRFLRSPSMSYFDILRAKLHWGHGALSH